MAWYTALSNLFDTALNYLFFFILIMPPALGIVTISFIITLISTLVYKWTTDQDVMKSLKDEINSMQKQVKENKNDIAKMGELNKKMMDKNFEYMKSSFKPMIYTMLPLLIIFAWVGAHLAYQPITPDTQFNITMNFDNSINGTANITLPAGMELIGDKEQSIIDGKAVWNLKGKAGEYALQLSYDNKLYEKVVEISNEKEYSQVSTIINDGEVKTIDASNEKVKLFGINWFWTYLITAILFSTALRKILKIY